MQSTESLETDRQTDMLTQNCSSGKYGTDLVKICLLRCTVLTFIC